MAKRGRRRRQRRRSEAVRLTREFAERSRRRYVDATLSSEEVQARYSVYRQYIADKEKDVLSRTVFITQVRDLHVPGNLERLRSFMEQTYGPVVECKATSFSGRANRRQRVRYPPARVQFQSKASAEGIFGGVELLRVRQAVPINCPVGYKNGQICVKPSELYDDMMNSALKGSVVVVNGSLLSLGHWIAASDELVPIENEETEESEWVQVTQCAVPVIKIDIHKRVVELHSDQQLISFRFKQLVAPMELCHEPSHGYSLVFKLKHPPKLLETRRGEDGNELFRVTSWSNVPINEFGRCLGYKILVSDVAVRGMLLHENHDKLKKFAVIKVDSLEQATPIISRKGDFDSQLEDEISGLQKPRIRKCNGVKMNSVVQVLALICSLFLFELSELLLWSLLGHGKFCSYHVLNESWAAEHVKREQNLITVLTRCSLDLAAVVRTILSCPLNL